MNYKVLVAATLVAAVVNAAEVDTQLPQGWVKEGAPPAVEQCLAGVDSVLEARGTPNITMRCDSELTGFVAVNQGFAASSYRGQRIRFSALVKAEGVEGGWGGIWMRVDDVGKPGAAFDNMSDRGVKGTVDWTPYSVVLDASNQAQTVAFGTLMAGKGQIWVSDLRFEVVGTDVPVTGTRQSGAPSNLQLAR
jgi:hypothetical protein